MNSSVVNLETDSPHCYLTLYADGKAHSFSGALSCAKRIADEIGGYVEGVFLTDPVYIVKRDDDEQ